MDRTDSTHRPLRLLRERLRELFRPLPKGLAGDEEAIHDMRVACRRLRAALPVLVKRPASRRTRRTLRLLRDLGRAASGSRDFDVALELLDDLRGKRPGAEVSVLRKRLADARRRRKARMAEDLLDLELAQMRRDLRKLVARGAEPLDGALGRLRAQADERGLEMLGAVERLAADFEPAALHAIRIHAKRLRYAAELQDALSGRGGAAVQAMKKVQEALGRMHDAHVLEVLLHQHAERDRARGAHALAAAADALAEHAGRRSREHHAAYLELGPVSLVRAALADLGAGREAA
jgi:CHAD domain-containing protein